MTNMGCQKSDCDGSAPLMRSPDKSKLVCVLCDLALEASANESVPAASVMSSLKEEQSMHEIAELVQEEADMIETMEDEEIRLQRREQSDRSSKLIGEKMLQGWKMLGEYCPNTTCHGIPLVANRNEEKFCVICDKFVKVVTEEEFEKMLAQQKMKDVVVPETTNTVLPPPVVVERVPEPVHTPLSSSKSTETLKSMLMNLTMQLESTPMTSIDQIARICDAMNKCAQALETLQRIQ